MLVCRQRRTSPGRPVRRRGGLFSLVELVRTAWILEGCDRAEFGRHLVWRGHPGAPQFLLAHPGGLFRRNRDAGAWSIPKGLVAPGETAQAAARRGFYEETGLMLTAPLEALTLLRAYRRSELPPPGPAVASRRAAPPGGKLSPATIARPWRSNARSVSGTATTGERAFIAMALAKAHGFVERQLSHLALMTIRSARVASRFRHVLTGPTRFRQVKLTASRANRVSSLARLSAAALLSRARIRAVESCSRVGKATTSTY